MPVAAALKNGDIYISILQVGFTVAKAEICLRVGWKEVSL